MDLQLLTKTYIDIDKKQLFVRSINGNKITVERGQDGTDIVSHVSGTPVLSITDADDAMIPMGDDFGFDGTIRMKMTKQFDELNDEFNVSADVVQPEVVKDKIEKVRESVDDVKKDYEYTRGNLYSIIEKGQEALNGIFRVSTRK